MSEAVLEMPSPDVCANTIFEISGVKFDAAISADLWSVLPKIRPTLTDEIIEEFQKDSITYSRIYDRCVKCLFETGIMDIK